MSTKTTFKVLFYCPVIKRRRLGSFIKKIPQRYLPPFCQCPVDLIFFSLTFLPPLYSIFDSGVGCSTDQTRSTQKNNCSSLAVVGGKYCFKKRRKKGSRIKREEEIIYGLHGSDVSPLKLVFSKYSL